MDKSLPMDSNREEAQTIEAAIDECLAKMQRANEQMDKDQTEIDRLKSETRSILEKLKAA